MGRIEQYVKEAKVSLERNRSKERQRVLRLAIKFQPVVFNEVTYSGPGSCGFVTDRENSSGKEVTPVVFRVGDLLGPSENKSGHTVREINTKAKELGFEFFSPEFEGVYQLKKKCPSFNKTVKDNRYVFIGMEPSHDSIEFFNGTYPDEFNFVPVQSTIVETKANSKYNIPAREGKFPDESMFLFALGEEPSIEGKKK